jgi:hypothetical protein
VIAQPFPTNGRLSGSAFLAVRLYVTIFLYFEDMFLLDITPHSLVKIN